MRGIRAGGAAIAAILAMGPASAAPIVAETVHASASQPAPDGIDPALIGPDGPVGGLLEGPIGLVTPGGGGIVISLADLGPAGNLYEVLLDGVALTASAGGGSYAAVTSPGGHALDVWDYALSYLGGTAPNGMPIDATFDPDPIALSITIPAAPPPPVPAPAFATVLGLFATAWLRRPRRNPSCRTESAR